MNMRRNVRILMMLTAMIAVLMLSSLSAFAAEGVDWGNSTITVTGSGIAPANARSAAQARMMARRAAVVDAYRQLAEAIKGVNVDSETTVQNMMVVDDTTKTKVSAFIQGAKILSEQVTADGGYEVTMTVSMFGVSNSLASAVMPKPAAVEAFPQPVAAVAPSVPTQSVQVTVTVNTQPAVPAASVPATGSSAAAAPAGKAIGGYTGLIVDCSGLGLKPVMSPVIKNASGQPIYGYKNLDYDRVVSNGMAGYTADIRNAVRAGANPLVVRAIGLDNHNGNPILSVADANRVLIENGASGFLDRTAVVFVR